MCWRTTSSVLRASKNPHPEAVDGLKLKMGQGITGWVAEHGRPVAVNQNASQDPRFQLFNDLPEDRFEAFLSVPLLSRGRMVGVINLQHREPRRYGDRQIRLISAVGLLVGAEIELARLESENVGAIGKAGDAQNRGARQGNYATRPEDQRKRSLPDTPARKPAAPEVHA